MTFFESFIATPDRIKLSRGNNGFMAHITIDGQTIICTASKTSHTLKERYMWTKNEAKALDDIQTAINAACDNYLNGGNFGTFPECTPKSSILSQLMC